MKKKKQPKKINPLDRFKDSIEAGHFTIEEVKAYLKKKGEEQKKKENREKFNRPAKIIYGHNTK